jgi:hypothetical protein
MVDLQLVEQVVEELVQDSAQFHGTAGGTLILAEVEVLIR